MRAVVLGAWRAGVGADALEDAVARLADAGAAVVTLAAGSDNDTAAADDADEDAVREAVERAHNLDVAGDAMLERLGVRGPLATCAAALRAGATRADAHERGEGGAARSAELLALAAELGREAAT